MKTIKEVLGRVDGLEQLILSKRREQTKLHDKYKEVDSAVIEGQLAEYERETRRYYTEQVSLLFTVVNTIQKIDDLYQQHVMRERYIHGKTWNAIATDNPRYKKRNWQGICKQAEEEFNRLLAEYGEVVVTEEQVGVVVEGIENKYSEKQVRAVEDTDDEHRVMFNAVNNGFTGENGAMYTLWTKYLDECGGERIKALGTYHLVYPTDNFMLQRGLNSVLDGVDLGFELHAWDWLELYMVNDGTGETYTVSMVYKRDRFAVQSCVRSGEGVVTIKQEKVVTKQVTADDLEEINFDYPELRKPTKEELEDIQDVRRKRNTNGGRFVLWTKYPDEDGGDLVDAVGSFMMLNPNEYNKLEININSALLGVDLMMDEGDTTELSMVNQKGDTYNLELAYEDGRYILLDSYEVEPAGVEEVMPSAINPPKKEKPRLLKREELKKVSDESVTSGRYVLWTKYPEEDSGMLVRPVGSLIILYAEMLDRLEGKLNEALRGMDLDVCDEDEFELAMVSDASGVTYLLDLVYKSGSYILRDYYEIETRDVFKEDGEYGDDWDYSYDGDDEYDDEDDEYEDESDLDYGHGEVCNRMQKRGEV